MIFAIYFGVFLPFYVFMYDKIFFMLNYMKVGKNSDKMWLFDIYTVEFV